MSHDIIDIAAGLSHSIALGFEKSNSNEEFQDRNL